ncbi:hypothetical protein QVD17_26877 [Tagetes erecta]|uniref:Uncharacterized protein n=1 Tax=Tagetes erecta TaxID=13708 RepID=A0AAD8K9V1_TARER|nr:hypothetical protein QVD17_26877 [Tagetes erecta]
MLDSYSSLAFTAHGDDKRLTKIIVYRRFSTWWMIDEVVVLSPRFSDSLGTGRERIRRRRSFCNSFEGE